MILLSLLVATGLYAQATNGFLDINPHTEPPGTVASIRTAPNKDLAADLVTKIIDEVAQQENVRGWIGESKLFLIIFRKSTSDPLQIRGVYLKEWGGLWFMVEISETCQGDPALAIRKVIQEIKGLPTRPIAPFVPSKTSA